MFNHLILLLLAFLSIQTYTYAQIAILEKPSQAYSVFQEGEALYIQGKYKEALPLLKKAAKSYSSNKEAQSIALVLEALAQVHSGKKEAAYTPFNEAEQLLKDKKIKSKEAIISLKFGLGAYHWSYKEKKEANQLMKEAEKTLLKEETVLPTSIGIEFYELLGELAKNKGAYPIAIEYYKKAVENAKKLDPTKRHLENYAHDQIIIGELYDIILAPDNAIDKYEKILAQKNEIIQDDEQKEIELTFRIGSAYFKRKEYEISLSYLEKSLEKIILTGKNPERKPAIQAMIATIYTDQRLYENALKLNSTALFIWKDGFGQDDNERVYRAHLNQSLIYRKLPVPSKSSFYYKKTVDESLENWEEAIKLRSIKAINHLTSPEKTADYNMSLLAALSAEDLISVFPKKQHPILLIEMNMVKGTIFFEASEYSRAKMHFQKALDLMKPIYEEKHPLVAEASRMLGEVFLAEKLFEEALSFVDKALNASMEDGSEIKDNELPDITKTKFPLELINAISTKGVILFNKGKNAQTKENLTRILHLYDLAIELLNKLRKTYRNEGAQYRLASIAHKFSQQAIIAGNALYQLTKEEVYLSKIFNYAELSKSSVLLEAIRDLKTREITGVPKEKIKEENKLKTDIAYLKGEIFYELKQGPNKNLARLLELDQQVKDKNLEHNAIIKELEEKYPKYYRLKYQYSLQTLDDLQKSLKKDEAFLEFMVADSFIYIMAIKKDSVKSLLVSFDKSVSKTIIRLHRYITQSKAKDFAITGYQLYKKILAPLVPFIKGKKLILSLDGELNYIPLGILPTNTLNQSVKGNDIYKNLDYFIYQHPICYNYSASIFLLNRNMKKSTHKHSISTWAPNFDSIEVILAKRGIKDGLDPLPGAQNEANHIAEMFKQHAFIKDEASEKSFKNLAHDYSVLHIATHGILVDKAPIFSSLVLGTGEEEDGLLHTYELYNMQLNSDLAVLSACNSGMGELAKGEGVMSLARGFAYAGVPNIVMSTWPVSDWSTEALMKAFYGYLQKGLAKDEALQQAKIDFLDANKETAKILAPFLWGSFVLTGDNAPVDSLIAPPTDNTLLYAIIVGFILFIIIVILFLKKRSPNTMKTLLILILSSFLINNSFAQDNERTISASICIQNAYTLDHVMKANVIIESLDENDNSIATDSLFSEVFVMTKLIPNQKYRISIFKKGFHPTDTVFVAGVNSVSYKQRLGIYIKPEVCYYIRGKITNSVNSKKVQTGAILIQDLDDNTTDTSEVNNGYYQYCGKCGHRYKISTEIDNHMETLQEFTLKSENCASPDEKKHTVDLTVTEGYGQDLAIGDSVTIHEFRFQGKTTSLSPKGEQELSKLIKVLDAMPNLLVEISIHTDPSQSHRYNKILSQKRAEVINQRLLSAGIAKERFEIIAMGEDEALFSDTEKNHRVVLIIKEK